MIFYYTIIELKGLSLIKLYLGILSKWNYQNYLSTNFLIIGYKLGNKNIVKYSNYPKINLLINLENNLQKFNYPKINVTFIDIKKFL